MFLHLGFRLLSCGVYGNGMVGDGGLGRDYGEKPGIDEDFRFYEYFLGGIEMFECC